MQKAGLACAVDAKLFEMVNAKRKVADPTQYADPDYAAARDAYLQAFYRVVYLGAENSVGFHNPTEAGRMAADALAYAGRAEGILKGMLSKEGITVPAEVPLDLRKYLDARGAKKLGFAKEQEFKDPFKVTDALYPENMKALRK
jgi:nitrite reductase (cytochrome c-552)